MLNSEHLNDVTFYPINYLDYCEVKSINRHFPTELTRVKYGIDYFTNNYDPEIFISQLLEVYLLDDSFLPLLPDGSALCDQSYHPSKLNTSGRKYSFNKRFEYFEDVIILGGSNNYYHNLLNWLPRYKIVSEFENLRDKKILVAGNLTENTLSLMSRVLGVPKSLFVKRDTSSITLVKNGYLPSFFQNPTHSYYAIDYIRASLKKKSFSKNKNKRIYISRKDAYPRRQLLNEVELFDSLKQFGFEQYTLSTLSIDEQVQLFADADIIVSSHGAGLTNLIFCDNNPFVIELQNKKSFTKVFWSLAGVIKSEKYEIIKCDEVEDFQIIPNNRNIISPIEIITKSISSYLEI